MGGNGSGKTTALKILAGIYKRKAAGLKAKRFKKCISAAKSADRIY